MAPKQNLLRPSAIAGLWYPGEPKALQVLIESYMDQVQPASLPGPIMALVSPHAGFSYSGTVAAHAYAQVRGATFQRVVLLGPLHRPIRGSQLGSFMIPTERAYATPLGEVAVDHEFAGELAGELEITPVRDDEEHALEIQLPFLQMALHGSFTIVPIMMGDNIAEPGTEERLGTLADRLAATIIKYQDREASISAIPCQCADRGDTLLVISTDLSHLDNYAEVDRMDRVLAALLDDFNVVGMMRALRNGPAQACGATGLIAGLMAARKLKATGVRVLARTSSAEITGNRHPGSYTVGYLAAAAYR